jgi:hypothetical protein
MSTWDLHEALGVLRRVEDDSRLLRGLGRTPGPCRAAGLWAVGSGWPDSAPLAVRVPDISAAVDPTLPAVRADAVVVGRASSDLLRLRAFYLDAGVTVAVNGRVPLRPSCRLLNGAAVLERVHGAVSLVVPSVLERGRRIGRCWIVEELLPGERFPTAEWPIEAPRLAEHLAEVWLSAPVSDVAIARIVPPSVLAAFDALLAEEGADRQHQRRLRDGVRRIPKGGERALVGSCHGDPVHGNWIRLPDRRPALLDWELARRRPLGHDASKLLVGLTDPIGVVEVTAPRVAGAAGGKAAPWRVQIASSLVRSLAAWRHDREVARQAGRVPAYQRRIRQRLDLLEQLIA